MLLQVVGAGLGRTGERHSPLLVVETKRLTLRHLAETDASFLCRLFNEPSWLQNIGDRGVRTPEEAERYIQSDVLKKYATQGFGMYAVVAKIQEQPVGVCGLFQRDGLLTPDLGFALLPEYCGRGYAHEAAAAVMNYARTQLGLANLLAITSLNNNRSATLLLKLGFRFEKLIRLPPQDEELKLYVADSK